MKEGTIYNGSKATKCNVLFLKEASNGFKFWGKNEKAMYDKVVFSYKLRIMECGSVLPQPMIRPRKEP